MDSIHQNPSIGVGSSSAGPYTAEISGSAPLPSRTRKPPERSGINKRKQTLLALIDELTQLRDEEQEKGQDIDYAPTADERLPSDSEGVKRFRLFDERIRSLILKLQAFANAVRQLGSSAGLLNAAYHLRTRLIQIQYLFRENAAELFDSISHVPKLSTKPCSARRWGEIQRHFSLSPSNNNREPWLDDVTHLPRALKCLAEDLLVFLDRLNEAPEFTDGSVNASILAFRGDLKHRASSLRGFEGMLKSVVAARYINDLAEDLGVHMNSMKDSLQIFIEVGVPTIRFSQKRTATGLQNLSVVATFFSGVTATALQYSHATHGSLVSDLVNALWISSLVFSIASAINSQLAYHWRVAMYCSPESYLPWWVAIWIIRTPLVFLVGSVIAFSAGLCAFTYSSNQSTAVSVVATTFTGITSSALLCVGLWFTSEWWRFERTQDNKWLLDVLEDQTDKLAKPNNSATVERPAERPVERPVGHSVERPFERPVEHPVERPVERPAEHPVERLVERPVERPVGRATARPIARPVERLVERPVGRSVERSVERPVGSSVELPVELPVERPFGRPGIARAERTLPSISNPISLFNAGRNSGNPGVRETRRVGENRGIGGNLEERQQAYLGDTNRRNLGVHGRAEDRKLSSLGRVNRGGLESREGLDLGRDTERAVSGGGPPHSYAATRPLPWSLSDGDNLEVTESGATTGGMASQANTTAMLYEDYESGNLGVSGNTERLRGTRFGAVAGRAPVRRALTSQAQLPEPVQPMYAASSSSESRHSRDSGEQQMNPTHVQGFVPTLRTLQPSQVLDEHVALVKHLQFSPDGQFLATCSWDQTVLIWRVGFGPSNIFAVLHKLVHTSRIGGFVGEVAWSPSGDSLLTKQMKSVKVWDTQTGMCKNTLDRKHNVQSITWMPTGSGFVSVEWHLDTNSVEATQRVHHTEGIQGSNLAIITADGTVADGHYLPRLQVWDAAVMPGEERIVAVASLLSSMDSRQPMRSRSEKRILVYNLQTKEIENQVPLLQEVRGVALTQKGNYALVSYENKSPPQAWRIQMIAQEQKCRLVHAHTYFTRHPVDFAGPSNFGGVNDMFVLCASKDGEIHIWDRVSGDLLHSLKAPDQELTNVAWNYKSSSGFMLASAAYDGMVRIWTTTT